MVAIVGTQLHYTHRYPDHSNLRHWVEHAAANGIKYAAVLLGQSDRESGRPGGEPWPGRYWLGGAVERDDNGDITTPLFDLNNMPDGTTPLERLLDLCAEYDIRVSVRLAQWGDLQVARWPYHPYCQDGINAYRNRREAGAPGWLDHQAHFFTDEQARVAFKEFLDFFVALFGDHPALWNIDIGSEIASFARDTASSEMLFSWLEDVSAHLWNILPGTTEERPFISSSHVRLPVSRLFNQASEHLAVPPEKVLLDWHNYPNQWNDNCTLSQLRDGLRGFLDMYPKSSLMVGEFWPWGESATPISPNIRDVNIGDECYERPGVPFDPREQPPYIHTRAWAALAASEPRVKAVMRWPGGVGNYGTGPGSFFGTQEIRAEMLRPCREMLAAPLGAVRHELGGDLIFQNAALAPGARLNFLMRGRGVQEIDFRVDGTWTLTTWNWHALNDVERIADGVEVAGGRGRIDFGQYSDGVCPGFLVPASPDVDLPVPEPLDFEFEFLGGNRIRLTPLGEAQ